MDTFGSRLKALRISAGLTQGQAAQRVGVARATWASWEVDRREPDHEMLVQLSRLFKVSVDSLVGLPSSAGSGRLNPDDPRVKRLAESGAFLHAPFELDEQDIKEIDDFIEYRRQKAAKRREREEQQKKGGSPTPG